MLAATSGTRGLASSVSTTGQELTAALDASGAGAKAYVLDLRDNGGGYLNAAIDVSSKFIAERTDRFG